MIRGGYAVSIPSRTHDNSAFAHKLVARDMHLGAFKDAAVRGSVGGLRRIAGGRRTGIQHSPLWKEGAEQHQRRVISAATPNEQAAALVSPSGDRADHIGGWPGVRHRSLQFPGHERIVIGKCPHWLFRLKMDDPVAVDP